VLAALGLLSFFMHSIVDVGGPPELSYWMMLSLVSGCALSFPAFRTCHKRQQNLIGQLHETERRLRAEISERGSASQNAAGVAEKNAQTLRNTFRASPDVMAALEGGGGGRFFAVNPAFVAFHGYARDEVKGRTPGELNLVQDPGRLSEIIEQFEREGHVQNAETAFRTSEGRIAWGLLSLATVKVVEKPYIFWIVRDITDRKRIEAELIAARQAAEAASRAKSEFLSSMSHEIRTPMNAVLGMAHLLAETELSEAQRHYLELMVANGNCLLELINSILDLARIESGRMQFEHSEFDLIEVVDKATSTFAARAHSKGLELVARIRPEVPDRLVGDPLRLRQVLTNLLSNAIKFTEIGEVVLEVERVTSTCGAEQLKFSVSDSGIGIARNKLDSIFRNFTQADSSTTRKYGGSGLGLAIAHRLVRLMGGSLSVESEVRKGSRFSFTASFGAVNSMNSTLVLSKLTGCRVLIVDDHHMSRLAAREMLEHCAMDVSEASGGDEALTAMLQAVLEGHPYRIVLLDLGMPGMDGYEMLQRMRAMRLPLHRVLPMLTCDKLKSQIDRLRAFGLTTRLLKPLARNVLLDAIQPLAIDGIETRMLDPTAAVPPHRTAGKRILVAEDSPDNRLVIAAYLRREMHHLEFAEDGLEAFNKFTTGHYDLVLMDIQMPEMDGLDATRAIRQWEIEHGRAPAAIVALTAYALEEDARRSLAAGCNLHLSKPLRKRALIECIRNATQHCDSSICGDNYLPASYSPAEPPLLI
jgi:PAS domain S-box-containing protein